MSYSKDEGYTYTEVKKLIQTSQTRGSLFTGGVAHGHASSLHQVITDTDLKNRLKMLSAASAFKDKADTNFGATIKTEDQAFLLTEILNSKLGRAALTALDAVPVGTLARMSICYLVGNSSSFALREAKLAPPAVWHEPGQNGCADVRCGGREHTHGTDHGRLRQRLRDSSSGDRLSGQRFHRRHSRIR